MNLKMPSGFLEKIRKHGQAAYPHECCGLLLGKYEPATKSVVGLKPAINHRDDSPRNRYLISARDMLQAERESQANGLDIIGIYHSHPDHPNRPSEYDRAWAQPNFSYVITSVEQGRAAGSRSWRLREDRTAFDEEELHTTSSESTRTRS